MGLGGLRRLNKTLRVYVGLELKKVSTGYRAYRPCIEVFLELDIGLWVGPG